MCSRADTKQMAARGKVLAPVDSEEPLFKQSVTLMRSGAEEAVHTFEMLRGPTVQNKVETGGTSRC